MHTKQYAGQTLKDLIYDTLCRDDWYSECHSGKHRVWYIKDIAAALGYSQSGVNRALKQLGESIEWEAHPFWTEGGYSMEYRIRLTDWTTPVL